MTASGRSGVDQFGSYLALVRIGDTLAPLATLSVGLQLRFDALREYRRLLCVGLGIPVGLLTAPAWLWVFDRLAQA